MDDWQEDPKTTLEDEREPRTTVCDHCILPAVLLLHVTWDGHEEDWCRSCINLEGERP